MFSPRIKSYRFLDEKSNCILHLPQKWEVEMQNIPLTEFAGKGDSAWETGIFYFTYNDPLLLQGILNCWKKVETKKGYYYQGYRFPNFGSEDMSRDQTITPLAALYHNGQEEHLKEIASHLRYRLSKRYKMQSMYFWVKYLSGKKWAGNVFGLFTLLENSISYSINKLVRRIFGIHKSYTPDEAGSEEHKERFNWYNSNKFKKFKHKAWFMRAQPMPAFAVHLNAWMVSCLKDGWIKRLNEKLIIWEAEESNYMVRMLCRDNSVTQEQIDSWKPTVSFRWQHRLNIQSWLHFLNPDVHIELRKHDGTYRSATREDMTFNCVDKDILYVLKNKL